MQNNSAQSGNCGACGETIRPDHITGTTCACARRGPVTMLRPDRRNNASLRGQLAAARDERENYRMRATKAEQEVAEWKRRFDALLKIVPEKGS